MKTITMMIEGRRVLVAVTERAGPKKAGVVDDVKIEFDDAKETVKSLAHGFAKTFADRGPRDPKGRGLRDFDLTRRLFRYPVSYMIYSATLDSLPTKARERIYRKLYDVLTGPKEIARFTKEERQAAVEIVHATKSNLPEYWK